MTVNFPKDWIESRRLYLLRCLVEGGGSCLESLLLRAGMEAFRQNSEDEIRDDIKHLIKILCIETDTIDTRDGRHSLLHLTITTRGEMAAEGRGEPVPGVQHSRWKR